MKDAFYFMGVDPAPALGKRSDDGGLSVLRAMPKVKAEMSALPADWYLDFIWAARLRGKDVREWSGYIHLKHQHFNFSGILLDAGSGGGGTYIMQEMAKHRQLIQGIETMVRPICTMEDAVADGEAILSMFWRREVTIKHLWPHLANDSNLPDNMHVASQQAVEHAMFNFPKPFNERPRAETELWPVEQQWALKMLDEGRRQMSNIQVVTRDDGTFLINSFGARSFEAVGKKDIAYSMLMAYVRFLIWLRLGAAAWQGDGPNAGMVASM